MAELLMSAKGINGQLELYVDKIVIKRKGILSFMTQGLKGDKDILLSSISSIQLKNASMLTNGYIQFAFMGGQEGKRGLFQATQDENTVMFDRKQQPDFDALKTRFEALRSQGTQAQGGGSNVDALERLAALREKGILTDEEFAAEKRRILGLG